MKSFTKTISIAGKELVFETGKIARLASGAVTLQSGETILLATACRGNIPSEDTNFLPLRVDYQEKFSSTGKTLGGFIKREGKPTERETLVCRLMDRPLRPMFEEGLYNEIQVLTYVLSYDGVHAPEPLAICAASAALAISDIPLIKPIGAVRVGFINNEFVINPSPEELKSSRLDLILAGTEDAILMIEGFADFLTEEQMLLAVEEGHAAIKIICEGLAEWQKEIGKPKYRDELKAHPASLFEKIKDFIEKEIKTFIRIKEKKARNEAIVGLQEKTFEHFASLEHPVFKKSEVKEAFERAHAHFMRQMVLNEKVRIDGRSCDQVRPISIDMHLLPRTHGSALFTRGETQALCVATLGGENAAQRYETLHDDNCSHRFYLQYSFPPFSVGEVGRIGAPGRREVGHGKLAERALMAILPKQEKFPYVIRLESTITESNGSSSMASVCGGCLALMDAGVPIRHPVAGIAMGLILEGDKFAILSDILGDEDFLGDMDFKVAGDAHGITAFQLDIKIEGINKHIMEQALAQAKQGRIHILNEMLKACPGIRAQMSPYAPRIETIQVKPSKIGAIIGPGGKQIRAITEETGAQIDISDSGLVSISASSTESMERARQIIVDLTSEVEKGKIYKGPIVSIVEFGVFVKIFDKEGLCHISEFDHKRIPDLRDVCKIGDIIEVKVLDINERGQIKLSRKALIAAAQPAATSGA